MSRDPIKPSDAHVLIIEDNIQNFVVMARLLAFQGVKQCQWKASTWQVLEFAESMPQVDLILMEMPLSYEGGMEETLAQLRAEARFRDIPIVLVTHNVDERIVSRAREAGFDGFIGKPLDPDRFPEQIKKILAGEAVWEP